MTKVKQNENPKIMIKIMICCFLICLNINLTKARSIKNVLKSAKKPFFNHSQSRAKKFDIDIKPYPVCFSSRAHKNKFIRIKRNKKGNPAITFHKICDQKSYFNIYIINGFLNFLIFAPQINKFLYLKYVSKGKKVLSFNVNPPQNSSWRFEIESSDIDKGFRILSSDNMYSFYASDPKQHKYPFVFLKKNSSSMKKMFSLFYLKEYKGKLIN